MKEIDLTTPKRVFKVPTAVPHPMGYGLAMGPDVKVNAHNAEDAKRRVAEAGHTVNRHFEPTEVKE